MKIVTYHGPPELKDEYLRVTDVIQPEQVLGRDIVGIYPDQDTIPALGSNYDMWRMIVDRIRSRNPFKKR